MQQNGLFVVLYSEGDNISFFATGVVFYLQLCYTCSNGVVNQVQHYAYKRREEKWGNLVNFLKKSA